MDIELFCGDKIGHDRRAHRSVRLTYIWWAHVGRLLAGFVSNKLGDKLLIRIGAAVELVGIILVFLPVDGYIAAAVGFVIIGTGMGPIYPAIQHMAPNNFGRKYSAAVIGLQMASAYVGSTFMPMLFGKLQQGIGIWIMPIYLLICGV